MGWGGWGLMRRSCCLTACTRTRLGTISSENASQLRCGELVECWRGEGRRGDGGGGPGCSAAAGFRLLIAPGLPVPIEDAGQPVLQLGDVVTEGLAGGGGEVH